MTSENQAVNVVQQFFALLSRCSKDGQNEIVFGHEQTH
jgi:hypothetical protein